MTKTIFWNRDWTYLDTFTYDWILSKEKSDNETSITIPHTVTTTPFNYFDEEIYQKVCGYKKVFTPDEEWKEKEIVLHVGAAAHLAYVYLNGKLIGEHKCGYTAFDISLNSEIKFNEENILVIKLDSREQQNVPPFGYVIDYMTYGGIYRDVTLIIKDEISIDDVYIRTNKNKLFSQVTLNKDVTSSKVIFRQSLLNIDGEIVETFKDNELEHEVKNAKLWSVEEPNLYILRTSVLDGNEILDTKEVRFGFRDIEFKADGFYLNNKKIKIRGLNRHQSFPYVGYAMPKSMQRFDADIIKNELGLNAVRTSHYPQSQDFVDRCDELGVLVFTEMPGWQHIGDSDWKKQAVKNVEEMVLQYRNHPSIILWGVRINESQDDDEFYKETNKRAHALDDRPTSGVRCITKSHLFEDVYAFNDFSHSGKNAGCMKKKNVTSDINKGYFISEYNGHMYPTKAYDTEDHRVEHMLRHARVMDAYYGEDDIAGGFGWCMFDYNTHRDFGSGDRICYHGVMDMFRNPKLAAAVYESQQDSHDVLEISSAMDIGEHPECLMKDVYAITNADSVRLYKNDTFVREFFASDTPFKNLPHGPIKIDDFIGNQMEIGEGFSKSKSDDVKNVLMSASRNGMANLPLSTILLAAKCVVFRGMKPQDAVTLYNKYVGNWGGTATAYKFEAIKNGKVVKTVIKKPMTLGHLEASISHTKLVEEETYDVASIRIKALNEDNEILSFASTPISLRTEGPIELIGPHSTSLQGGMSGAYIKTTGVSGNAKLIIESEAFATKEISFEVKVM